MQTFITRAKHLLHMLILSRVFLFRFKFEFDLIVIKPLEFLCVRRHLIFAVGKEAAKYNTLVNLQM